MNQYYLRVEAVNLNNFVYDAQDLSTIRGGGLLLLDAIDNITDLARPTRIRPLTTGASAGLFEFDAVDLGTATQIRDQVRQRLANDVELQHATFVADVQPSRDDQHFAEDIASLLAKNRWQQMQSLTVALPATTASQACEIDLVRPATRSVPAPEGKTFSVSESVAVRRLAGQRLKQNFYQRQIKEAIQAQFVREIKELTEDKSKGDLNEKMAVIYLDGNRFGKIKDDASHSRAEWQKFDTTVKSYRREMLEGLLGRMKNNTDWQNDGRYRIETLLWGGDEILWVVPAWKGWETLQYFYEISSEWHFNSIPLRHSAGLVFCHHNAPIHRITQLAKDLAELAKEKNREQNLFAYEVLESFDHIGRNLQRYREERCPQPVNSSGSISPQALILAGPDMQDMFDFVSSFAEEMPRKQLHEITAELLWRPRKPVDTAKRQRKRAYLLDRITISVQQAGVSPDLLKSLKGNFGGEEAFWLHVNALWGYLV